MASTVSFPMLYSSRMSSRRLPAGNRALIQIVDAALADTAQRSGNWLACQPGCTQCCVGVFAIDQLDVARLQDGLARIEKENPQRARHIRERAQVAVARMADEFPGDSETGVLDEGADAEDRFDGFANDEICPVLDPKTGLCELYDSRPMTCRTFGPPVRSEDGLGVCELCFHGASDGQIAGCEMVVTWDEREKELLAKLEKSEALQGRTIVAFAVK